MNPTASAKPIWLPNDTQIQNSNMQHFANFVSHKRNLQFSNYFELHKWSINSRSQFWFDILEFSKMKISANNVSEKTVIQNEDFIFETKWFPTIKLNYAENLLQFCKQDEESVAIVSWIEDKVKSKLTRKELYQQVSKCAQALRNMGLKKGDRVAGFLPNISESIIAMLATTSIGAVWSSASPDFGVQGVIDRLGQIEPKIFFAVDGYWYNGKQIDCCDKISEIIKKIPSIEKTIVISLFNHNLSSGMLAWDFFLEPWSSNEVAFEQVEFSAPLFIMFSSGTTGVPKCIVHGHGGTLIQHLKEHRLHCDIKPKDRLFYFTTLGWMMWNWMVSVLASEAILLLYDGSPFAKDGTLLFDFAEQEKCTHFGTSAKFLDAAAKSELHPVNTHSLVDLRFILSTGSPLAPEGFDYVYEKIKSNVCLASISGGTDIVSCFMLGNPALPVWRGEIQCAGLGMAVEIFNDSGEAIENEKGELVCTKSFPSMPVGFWNDPDSKKYYEAYFSQYPNVWCHGDFVQRTKHGGYIIYGRSDAVLNPGGVRIGTAEIYRQVEKLSEVMESIVIGQDWERDIRIILFVKLKEGLSLTDELRDKIKKVIRENTTPRHVPTKILQVKDIPRTKSGKIVELAVRNVIHGRAVKNKEALANPEALDFFINRPELVS